MSLWSGSATERVLACPASAALPSVRYASSDDARVGTAIHAFVRTALVRGRDAALREVEDPDLVPRCAAIRLGALAELGDVDDAEVAYGFRLDSGEGRVLGRNLGRGYPRLFDDEIPTTTDVEIVQRDGVRLVVDLKTGWQWVPGDTPQIRFHALAVGAARGIDPVRVAIARIDEDGEIDVSRPLELDAIETGSLAHDLRRARDRVLAARVQVATRQAPDVSAGPWCRYCPAQSSCPARVGLARAVLATDPETARDRILAMSPDEGGALWERLQAGKEMLKTIESSLKDLAERSPLALPDGSTLEMRRVHFDAPAMVPDPSGATKTVDYMRPTVVRPAKPRKRTRAA